MPLFTLEKTINPKPYSISKPTVLTSKIQDYVQLVKMRLSLLVVFSAAMGFLLASEGEINWGKLCLLILGGFLVTASSNGINQVVERHLDKLMTRTSSRPIPDSRMRVSEALLVSILMGVVGILILSFGMNLLSGIFGAFALLSYVFIYTPMKRKTPFAVFAGAIPGAIPPLLGYVAVTGHLDITAYLLYAIQFIWQFPHFWSIAWVLDDDYKKAGFKMLPSAGGRDKKSAYQALIYTLALIPLGLLPVYFNVSGYISAIVITLCGVLFMMQSIQLYRECSIKAATRLMFGSFLYLPLVQIAMVYDKM